MASVIKLRNAWYVQVRIDGVYRKFYGFRNKKTAAVIGEHIEELKAGRKHNCIARETRAWLSELETVNPALYDRLAQLGLAEPRKRDVTLPELLNWYETYPVRGLEPKPATKSIRRGAGLFLLSHLAQYRESKNDLLAHPAPEEVSKFLDQLRKSSSAETAKRYFSVIKSVYANGVAEGKVRKNPFEKAVLRLESSEKQQHFYVTEEIARQVLRKIPDLSMRAVWVLARWGGIRIPSEVQFMLWGDIDFERRRIKIREPKKTSKQRQDRGEHRVREIPLFPEIYSILAEYRDHSFTQASDRMFSDAGKGYSQYFTRCIRAAGIAVWPKLFNSLRATRDTELQKKHPPHVVSSWLGHTIEISQKYYIQTTDEDFEKALEP